MTLAELILLSKGQSSRKEKTKSSLSNYFKRSDNKGNNYMNIASLTVKSFVGQYRLRDL